MSLRHPRGYVEGNGYHWRNLDHLLVHCIRVWLITDLLTNAIGVSPIVDLDLAY